MRNIAIQRMRPVYCAVKTAQAMPLKPRPNFTANSRQSPRFATFTVISAIIGLMAFCIPMKKPLNTNSERVAGAAQILMK